MLIYMTINPLILIYSQTCLHLQSGKPLFLHKKLFFLLQGDNAFFNGKFCQTGNIENV